MSDRRTWLRDLRVPAAMVLCAAVWALWLLATRSEISVWADFRRDVTVRDGYALDEIADIRFYDSAPYSIWLPSDIFVWGSLRRGEMPLWDRSQAGGYSPVLNLQNGVMHPLRWATVAVPRPFASSALVIGMMLVLAIGTFLMLRREFGTSESAAVIGAVSIAICGYVLSTIHYSGVLLPLVHVPWLVWSHSGWVSTRRTSWAAGLAATVALLAMSGHPLMIVVALLVAGFFVAWPSVASGRGRSLMAGGCIGLAGFMATSVVSLPMVMNLGQIWSYKNTTTEGMSYALVSKVDLADALWGMVAWMSYEGDFIDGGPIVFHLGAVATLLMLVGVVIAFRSRRTAVVSLLLIVGWLLSAPTALTVKVVQFTPFAYFKPWYLMFLFVFPAAIAISLGADRMLAVVPGRFRSATAACILMAIVIPGVRPLREVLRPRTMKPVSSPALGFLGEIDEPFRVVGLSGQTHAPNVGRLTGVDDVRFSSPVQSKRYHEWYRAAVPSSNAAFPTITMVDDASSPLFGTFNVRFVLRSTVPGHDIQSFLPRVGDRPSRGYAVDPPPDSETHASVFAAGAVEIHEVRQVHPRAHFADKMIVVADMSSATERLGKMRGDPGVEVVEASDSNLLAGVEPRAASDGVRLEYPSLRTVRIATKADGPRLLVLHDSWDRGWRATMDGRPTEIFPTSLVSRGIVVPAGEHRIEMSFIPHGMEAGACVSLLAIVVFPILARRLSGEAEAR